MLHIEPVSIQLCRDVRAIEARIPDKELVDQMRRAASSVTLNLAESNGVRGGNRIQRRLTALGSAYELQRGFVVADATYGVRLTPQVRNRLNHVIGVLVKLTR